MTSTSRPAQQPYELFGFARKYGLSIDAARIIIDHFGVDREGADNAALRLWLLRGSGTGASGGDVCETPGLAERVPAPCVRQPRRGETAQQKAARSYS